MGRLIRGLLNPETITTATAEAIIEIKKTNNALSIKKV